jgi:hypothetical protein
MNRNCDTESVAREDEVLLQFEQNDPERITYCGRSVCRDPSVCYFESPDRWLTSEELAVRPGRNTSG